MAETIVVVKSFEELKIEVTPFEDMILKITSFDDQVIIVPGQGAGIFDLTFDETFE